MPDIISMVSAAVQLLTRSGELVKALSDQILSDNEKELLLRAAKTPGNAIMILPIEGGIVRCGNKDYVDSQDRLVQEEALEALASLVAREVVRQESEAYFCLNAAGIRKARALE